MPSSARLELSVLLFREGDYWIAQCLELDIAAQGRTLKDVEDAFAKTVLGQMMVDLKHGKIPFEGIGQAPQRFWGRYRREAEFLKREPIRIPEYENYMGGEFGAIPEAYKIQAISSDLRVA